MKTHKLQALRNTSLLLLASLTSGCGMLNSTFQGDDTGKKVSPPTPDCRLSGSCAYFADIPAGNLYQSCEEAQSSLVKGREQRKKLQEQAYAQSDGQLSGGAPKASRSEALKSTNPDITTNVQEAGVDEADLYKVSATHIYVVQGNSLVVLDRSTLDVIGSLQSFAGYSAELYTVGDKLIVVDAVPSPQTEPGQGDSSRSLTSQALPYPGSGYGSSNEFRVRIFESKSGSLPVLKKETKFPGFIKETRFEKGRLIVVSSDSLYNWDPNSNQNIDTAKKVSCNRILKPQIVDGNEMLTTLRAFSIENDQSSEVSFLGYVSQVYMAPGSLYLSQPFSNLAWPENGASASLVKKKSDSGSYLQTLQLSDAGEWSNFAAGIVPGYIKDKWAFKELESKHLALATTTGHLWGKGADQAKNHLFVLQRKGAQLVTKASVRDFGLNEDIRSVRYLNNIAYIVTFKKTDPLFAISLVEPENPKMLGELKIPGFSTYMQPLSDSVLAGIGYDAVDAGPDSEFAWYQGLQVSLFDISNPKELKRLDVKVLGERGSYSEATSNSHAFFYDPNEKLLGLPVTLLNNPQGRNGSWSTAPTPQFTGAIFYDVSQNSLNEVARISHAAWMPKACESEAYRGRWWQSFGGQNTLDVARLFRIDGSLLSLSPFGLKSWRSGVTAAAEKEVQFPSDPNTPDCSG